MGPTGLKSRSQQNRLPSGGSRRESVSLTFRAFRDSLELLETLQASDGWSHNVTRADTVTLRPLHLCLPWTFHL